MCVCALHRVLECRLKIRITHKSPSCTPSLETASLGGRQTLSRVVCLKEGHPFPNLHEESECTSRGQAAEMTSALVKLPQGLPAPALQ